MIYLQLAYEFFKTGLFAVGGGLATLPFLMQMSPKLSALVFHRRTHANGRDIGIHPRADRRQHGDLCRLSYGSILGAVTATFALVLPAFLAILIVFRVLDRFQTNRRIMGGMEALRSAVTGLIAAAGYVVLKSVCFPPQGGLDTLRWIPLLLFAVLFLLLRFKRLSRIHPIAYIAVGAILGIVLRL